MSYSPLVSIIMPVYNSEDTLIYTINSVLHQKFKDWQLLCIDDGSTDNSSGIISDFVKKDDRINYFYKKNSGVSDTRNFGLNLSQGEFIFFLDSDDICKTNLLSEAVSAIEKFDCDTVIFGYDSIVKGNVIKSSVPGGSIGTLVAGNDMARLLRDGLISVVYNKLYRKSLLKHNSFENTSLGEDFLFNLDVILKNPSICALKESLYMYNLDSVGSLYKKFSSDRSQVLRLEYDKIVEVANVYKWSSNVTNDTLNYFKIHNLSGVIMNDFRDNSPYSTGQKKSLISKEFNFYKVSVNDILACRFLSKIELVKLVCAKLGLMRILNILYFLKKRKVKV